jgi:hypothetical protein
METRGNRSRWLALAGLGVVLGLGLLFQVSASGQQPAPTDPKDRRDQEIEALKKAIKALEEQKKADAKAQNPGAAPTGRGAPADLAGQLKEVEAQIARQREELRALEAKAQDLRAKIKAGEAAKGYGPPGGTPPPGTTDRRMDDLEKKMDLLQKELEGLRRELRRGRVNPPGGSGGRPDPELPGSGPPPAVTAPRGS